MGGITALDNLCIACPFCNRRKSNHQMAIDPVSSQEINLFHPQQQVWTEHFSWSDNGQELMGVTTVARATIELLQMNRPTLMRARMMWVRLGEHPPRDGS
jgi:hypothetical protein